MFNFQLACAKKIQPKNKFFLHCRQIWNDVINLQKNLEKIIRSKYRSASPEIQVFFILRCLKMHQ